MAKDVYEIRWHGRGGQGAKTAATLVAEAAMERGAYGQGFPDYGPERMGAPMRGYTRMSDEPILIHSAVYYPDAVVVLDDTLLETVDVCENLAEDGVVIVNSKLPAEEIRKRISAKKQKLFVIDAQKISVEELGRPMPNTPMIGALAKATGKLDLDPVKKLIKKKFGKKFGEKVVQANQRSVERAYEEVKTS